MYSCYFSWLTWFCINSNNGIVSRSQNIIYFFLAKRVEQRVTVVKAAESGQRSISDISLQYIKQVQFAIMCKSV